MISGPTEVSFNETNYYAQGTKVQFTLPPNSDKVFISVSGASEYTLSDDNLNANITFGASDVNVTTQTVNGTCGDNATWVLEKDNNGNYTRLIVSGSGALSNYGYTTVDGLWRTNAPWGWGLTSVNIGNEITSIGEFAFVGWVAVEGGA